MIPLNLFFINVGIILVHVANERQGGVEEGGVLVTVRVVLVGSADGGVTVDYRQALNWRDKTKSKREEELGLLLGRPEFPE